MRKFTLLLTLALAMVMTVARAETVTSYSYGFDTFGASGTTATSLSSSFTPPGWGHIVDYLEGYWSSDVYVTYKAYATGGVDDSGYLYVGTQSLKETYGDSKTCKDMIVTPAILGSTASIYVKQTKDTGTVTFYTCTKADDGTFTAGDEFPVTLPTLSTSDWTKVEISDIPEGTYLGICGDCVRLDQFEASSVDLNLKRSMIVVSSPTMVTGTDLDADGDGNVTITASVKVKNNGEKALAVGDEDYYVSIYDNTASIEYAKVAVPQALAIGEMSDAFTVSATIPVTENNRHGYYVKEYVSGSTTYLGWVEVYPAVPVFSIEDSLGHDVNNGDAVDFSTMSEDVVKSFVLKNTKGGAPLTISSITVPEGFSYEVTSEETNNLVETAPYVIPAHGKMTLKVTMLASTIGQRSGNIVITPAEGQGDAYTLPVSGQIIDPSSVFINFNDQKFPAGTLVETSEGSKKWTVESYWRSDDYTYAATSSVADPLTKFVLPKISLAEGEHISFLAGKRGSNSVLNVYYSADRKNWTLAKAITVNNEDESCCFTNDTYSGSYDNFKYKTFTLDAIPAGEWYIAFEAGYCRVDNIAGGTYVGVPDYEGELTDVKIPETATVNNACSASATLAVFGNLDLAEGAAKAKLYIDGEVVGEQAISAVATGEYQNVKVTFTPRKAGEFAAKFVVEGVLAAESAESTITVAGEQTVGDAAICNASSAANDVPFQLNYNNSQCEIIYSAEQLAAIPAGTSLKSLYFKGYKSAYTLREIPATVKIWMENTTDTDPTTSTWYATDAMTQVYNADYTFPAEAGSADNHEKILDVTFDEPFVYTGGNLRIVMSSESTTYNSTYFEIDATADKKAAVRYSDGTVSGSLSLKNMPVAHFGFDKENSVFSGKVTSSADGSAVADAAVKLVSDNVEYSGTTNENGEYSFVVYQDTRDYALTVTKEGFFTYRDSVEFKGASIANDVAMRVATGVNILSVNIPATGEVNATYVASAKIENAEAREAGSYAAELWANGTLVASADPVALDANAEAEFTFAYVPHTAGTTPTYVRFVTEQANASSEAVEVAISEEKGNAEVLVGTTSDCTSYGPANFYYKNSRTEIIYPKSLIGLAAGTKINAIKFYGSHSAKDFTSTFNAWVQNVDEGTALQGDVTDDSYKVVTDQTISFNEAIDASNMQPVVTIEFPDGFTYTGGDIRIYTTAKSDNYTNVSFEVDNTVAGQAQQAAADSESSFNSKELSAMVLPVAHFVISPYKTFSGTVKDAAGNAVANTYVTLTSSDNVQYSTSSDEEGAFAINVIKTDRKYALTVENAAYDAYVYTDSISLAEGNVENFEIVLSKSYEFSGQVVNAADNTPIQGAKVAMYAVNAAADAAPVAEATTDEKGNFKTTFSKLGSYNVIATAEGYDKVIFEGIELDGDLSGTVIEMTKTTYKIDGVVYDSATNAKIEGAKIYFDDPTTGNNVAEATSDANGAFVITLDKVGTYSVLIQAAGYDNFISDMEVEGSTSVEVPMTKTTYKVDGMVYDSETYAAIEGAKIYFDDPTTGSTVAEATSDATGAFVITLDKVGTYSVLIQAAGYDNFISDIEIEGSTSVEVPMTKTAYHFSGLVGTTTYEPIAGAKVSLKQNGETVAEATSDETGAFDVVFSALGTYTVTVEAEGYETFSQDDVLFEASMLGMEIYLDKKDDSVGVLTADGLRVYGATSSIVVNSPAETTVRVYNTAGSLIRSEQVVAGKNVIDSLSRGIYIVNGVKVIVK